MTHENHQNEKNNLKAPDSQKKSEKAVASKEWRDRRAQEGKKQLSISINAAHEDDFRALSQISVALPPGVPLFTWPIVNLPDKNSPESKPIGAGAAASSCGPPLSSSQAEQKSEPPTPAPSAPKAIKPRAGMNYEWDIGSALLNPGSARARFIRWLATVLNVIDFDRVISHRKTNPNICRWTGENLGASFEYQIGNVFMNSSGPALVFMRLVTAVLDVSPIFYYRAARKKRLAQRLSEGRDR